MKTVACFLVVAIVVLSGCSHKPKPIVAAKKPGIYFSDKPNICDTCTTIILVHHIDATGSGEITVDSGTVYVPEYVLQRAQHIRVDTDTTILPRNCINISELNFETGKGYGKKLWKDSVSFGDQDKPFRLKGKIVDVKRAVFTNGVEEVYPSLFFRVEKFEPVDINYWKKVINEIRKKDSITFVEQQAHKHKL